MLKCFTTISTTVSELSIPLRLFQVQLGGEENGRSLAGTTRGSWLLVFIYPNVADSDQTFHSLSVAPMVPFPGRLAFILIVGNWHICNNSPHPRHHRESCVLCLCLGAAIIFLSLQLTLSDNKFAFRYHLVNET